MKHNIIFLIPPDNDKLSSIFFFFIILAFFICFVYDRDNFYWTDLNLFSQRRHV